jgi:hypothetical protein
MLVFRVYTVSDVEENHDSLLPYSRNVKMPTSMKDLWLERQENKEVALEKLARMMDVSNIPSHTK